MKTIERGIVEQVPVHGDTPPTPGSMPMSPGLPPNTASMCEAAPGSTSVTVALKRENSSCTQLSTVAQFAALMLHAPTCEVELMMLDLLVDELSVPGVSVTPLWLR